MPREAWRSAGSSSIRGADALSQINSSPSSVTIADESSQDVSCMRSERGRKLAEEWWVCCFAVYDRVLNLGIFSSLDGIAM